MPASYNVNVAAILKNKNSVYEALNKMETGDTQSYLHERTNSRTLDLSYDCM